ncbi:MAG TPA: hypothetical protein EYG38_13790 [Verrucomicrobia bacterium]|nr:hypothetical protein [Verrucomicrobiota bacterium]
MKILVEKSRFNRRMKLGFHFALIFLTTFGFTAFGQTKDQLAAAEGLLKNVPTAEIAAKAAEFVSNAPTKEIMLNVAVSVTRAVGKLKPEVLSATVAAVISASPVHAPAVVTAAMLSVPAKALDVITVASHVPGVESKDLIPIALAAAPKGMAKEVFAVLNR